MSAKPLLAAEVQAILAQRLGREAALVPLGARLSGDLGLDSMALVEALFALEERFDVAIPLDAGAAEGQDLENLTVQALADRLFALGARA